MTVNLALVDTTGIDPKQLGWWRNAVQTQMSRDVRTAWALAPITLTVSRDLSEVPRTSLPVVILANADQAGALGYHDETPDGRPYARVFVHPTLDDGVALSTVISHEAIEALVDAHVNLWVNDAQGLLWAVEACDPCENVTYRVGGVDVSDFVLPSWFDANTGPGEATSHRSSTLGPFDVAVGGYAITYDGQQVSTVGQDRQPVELGPSKSWPAARTARRMALGSADGGTPT